MIIAHDMDGYTSDTHNSSARDCRKLAYPWLVEWLNKRFASVVSGDVEAADVATLDFSAMLSQLLESEMPPEVRRSASHIGVRHLKDQYVRCIQYPKRLGTMAPREREDVVKVVTDHVASFTRSDGVVSWSKLAEMVRGATGVRISQGNLKNMQKSISKAADSRRGTDTLTCRDKDAGTTLKRKRAMTAASECGETDSEATTNAREPAAYVGIDDAWSSCSTSIPVFEAVDNLTPNTTMRRVDEYLRQLVKSCELKTRRQNEYRYVFRSY
jgi:hypothetical protein